MATRWQSARIAEEDHKQVYLEVTVPGTVNILWEFCTPIHECQMAEVCQGHLIEDLCLLVVCGILINAKLSLLFDTIQNRSLGHAIWDESFCGGSLKVAFLDME
jgi:hypothetical protein